jgi:peroxiredoxin
MNKFFQSLVLMATVAMAPAMAVQIGEPAPQFELLGQDGKIHKLSDLKGKTVVLEWFNDGCPFVRKHYDSKNMQTLQKKYGADVVWLAINSSAAGKQGHLKDVAAASDMYKSEAMQAKALLLDVGGKTGLAYEAKTTPHMYIIKPDGTLAYQGAIDSISSAAQTDIPKATNYVTNALEDLKAGRSVAVAKTTAYGCAVKY